MPPTLEKSLVPPRPGNHWVLHYALRSVSPLWLAWVSYRLASSEHPLSRALRRSQQPGLHVTLVLRDEDRTPRPRVSTPFLGCLFVFS